jgi:hypothetical protein
MPSEQGPKFPDWTWFAFSVVALLLTLLVLWLTKFEHLHHGLLRERQLPQPYAATVVRGCSLRNSGPNQCMEQHTHARTCSG